MFQALGLPEPVAEYKFHPTRRWRIDWAWPEHKLAVELEGGCWIRGRHNRGSGYLKDMEKYNALTLMGFHLLRFTPQQWRSLEAHRTIQEWFIEKNLIRKRDQSAL